MCSPTVRTTLKNLGALYRKQGRLEAADTLEQCVKPTQPQTPESGNQRAVTKVPPSPSSDAPSPRSIQDTPEPGAMRRAPSLSKLAGALRRGGAKFMQKFRLADDEEQSPAASEGMKRAVSMSVLSTSDSQSKRRDDNTIEMSVASSDTLTNNPF